MTDCTHLRNLLNSYRFKAFPMLASLSDKLIRFHASSIKMLVRWFFIKLRPWVYKSLAVAPPLNSLPEWRTMNQVTKFSLAFSCRMAPFITPTLLFTQLVSNLAMNWPRLPELSVIPEEGLLLAIISRLLCKTFMQLANVQAGKGTSMA